MDLKLYQASNVDPTILLHCLIGFAVFLFIALYLNHKYKWFKKIRRLKEEMEYLELNPSEETMITKMIERYRLNEPVEVLLSLQLFDELACKEMKRVLESVGTYQAKQAYIEKVYEIRQRTFYPDLVYKSQDELMIR